jgi:hypothetical protein
MSDAPAPRLTGEHAANSDFEAFAAQDPGSACPAYVFFTGGLLHVFHAMSRTLPKGKDVRVVVSGISDEERDWLKTTAGRPLLELSSRVDDKYVWNQLGRSSPGDFMWLDVDLLLHDPSVLDDMTAALAREDVAMSGCLHHSPLPLLCTPASAVSHATLSRVRGEYGDVYLGAYGWSFTDHLAYSGPRLPEQQWQAVRRSLDLDGEGYPCGPQSGIIEIYDGHYYVAPGRQAEFTAAGKEKSNLLIDPLICYQLLALASGYRPMPVRDYPIDHRIGGDVSHIGGLSYLRRELGLPEYGATKGADPVDRYRLAPRYTPLSIEAFILKDFCDQYGLPGYVDMWNETEAVLEDRGVRYWSLSLRGRRLIPG